METFALYSAKLLTRALVGVSNVPVRLRIHYPHHNDLLSRPHPTSDATTEWN